MKQILRVKDVAEMLDISKAQASRLIKRVVDAYRFDPERMAIKGSVPADCFFTFYQLDGNRKVEVNENNKKE